MIRIRQLTKREARDLQQSCEDIQGAATVAGAALGYAASIGAGLAGLYDLANTAALALLFSAGATDLGRRAGRIANDPPDEDFERSSKPVVRRLDFEALRANGPLDRAFIHASAASFETAGYMSATARAFERALAAQRVRASEAFAARITEVTELANGTSSNLHRFADSLDELRGQIRQSRDVRAVTSRPDVIGRVIGMGRRSVELLPDQTLATLFRVGLRRSEIRPWTRSTFDSWQHLESVLGEATTSSLTLAEDLAHWEPRDEDDQEPSDPEALR